MLLQRSFIVVASEGRLVPVYVLLTVVDCLLALATSIQYWVPVRRCIFINLQTRALTFCDGDVPIRFPELDRLLGI